MNVNEAAELGAKLTVARAARVEQAREVRQPLALLAFLMRSEAVALREFAKGAHSTLAGEMEAEAEELESQSLILNKLSPAEPE